MINIAARLFGFTMLNRLPKPVKNIIAVFLVTTMVLVLYTGFARGPRENRAIVSDVNVITINNGREIEKVVLTFDNKGWILFGEDSFTYSVAHKDDFAIQGWLRPGLDRLTGSSEEITRLSEEIRQSFIGKTYKEFQNSFRQ